MAWGFYFCESSWQQDLCPAEVTCSPSYEDCGRRVGIVGIKSTLGEESLSCGEVPVSKVGVQRDLGNAGRSALHKWGRPLNRAVSWGAGTKNMEEIRRGNDEDLKARSSLENDTTGHRKGSEGVRLSLGAEERVFPEIGIGVRKGNGWNRKKRGGEGGFLQAHFPSSFCARSLLHFPWRSLLANLGDYGSKLTVSLFYGCVQKTLHILSHHIRRNICQKYPSDSPLNGERGDWSEQPTLDVVLIDIQVWLWTTKWSSQVLTRVSQAWWL